MGGKPRIRRTAAEARELILDAAESELSDRGPDGLRLEALAARVGVSHPTILHHFGSRTGLVEALVERTTGRLRDQVVSALAAVDVDELDTTALLDRILETLTERGHARTLAWLFLARGRDRDDPVDFGLQLREIASVMHALRRERHGDRTPPFEDTLFTALLASLALVGDALAGPALRRSAGIESDRAGDRRFVAWLAALLHEHLDSAEKPRALKAP